MQHGRHIGRRSLLQPGANKRYQRKSGAIHPHVTLMPTRVMARKQAKPQIVLCDWDNTLRKGFTVLAWARFLAGQGLFGTLQDMRNLHAKFRRGSLTYEQFCKAMAVAYADGLAGRTQAEVLESGAAFIRSDIRRIFKFVRPLWSYFDTKQFKVVVLSGAPEEALTLYASAVGFELGGALRLETAKGLYTGKVVENCGLAVEKTAAVRRVSRSNDIVAALGDANSDRPLLNAARAKFVVLGASHNSVPSGPQFVRFGAKRDPLFIVQLIKRHIAKTIGR